MKNVNIYSKKTLNVIRFIASATLILLLFTTYNKFLYFKINDFFISNEYSTIIGEYLALLMNFCIIIISAILIKYPHKFLLIGIISLIYSIVADIYNIDSITSFLMLAVALAVFLFRCNYKIHKKLLLFLFLPVTLFELLFPLTKGLSVFLQKTYNKALITFTVGIASFFFLEYQKQKTLRENLKDKVLNLAEYKGITKSDLYLLQDVMNNVKYKEISKKINGSEGALRNKLGKIYKILEVGDKTGFLTIYSGYTLIYEPDKK